MDNLSRSQGTFASPPDWPFSTKTQPKIKGNNNVQTTREKFEQTSAKVRRKSALKSHLRLYSSLLACKRPELSTNRGDTPPEFEH
jgi:hypothetical protein